MWYAILGPLDVWDGGQRVPLGKPQHRTVLAALLLDANRVVPADRLIECLWGDDPPPTARRLLHGCVAYQRRMLRTEEEDGTVRQPIVSRPPGYMLEVRAGELDLDRFDELVSAARAVRRQRSADSGSASGRNAEADGRAAGLLQEALSLWRGQPLDGIPVDALRAAVTDLAERRLAVLSERIDIDLRLGRQSALVGELQALVAEHPLRERFWAQLMCALYADNRQAEALAAFRQLRETLVEQLGIEPSPPLQQLERAILVGGEVFGTFLPAPDTFRSAPGPEVASGRVPAQLPAAITSFTGRDEHLRQLDALLPGTAAGVVVVVITGIPGVGKTALAVHWGHRVSDRFPDGQLYLNLRGYAPTSPLRPIEALACLLHALGLPAEQVPAEPEQAAALYRTMLSGKRVLVVLDDASGPEQVRPLLPGGPGCLVVVTGRDRLGGLVARDDAQKITLGVLPAGEAQALLGRLLGSERTAAEPAAVGELAQLCGLLPLALRIAASNLIDRPQQTIASYAAGLRRGGRLSALQVDGDEQATIRATFDLSYAGLEPAAQRHFRLLGVAPIADFAADAAAAITGTTEGESAKLLHRLASAHLLDQHASDRFGYHDLLRLYAAERARGQDGPDECDAATHRLLDWYLRTANAAAAVLYPTFLRLEVPADSAGAGFGDRAQALAWLDSERHNLLSCVEHAAEHGPQTAAWLMADALRGYFWLRMYTVDWLAVAFAALRAAEAEGDAAAQAACRLSIADAYRSQSHHRQAIEHYTHALALARRTGWMDAQATALGNLGNAYGQSGQPHAAVDHFTQALTIDRMTGRLAGQVANLGNLGIVYRELGRLHESVDQHSRALALNRKIGSFIGEAIELGNLGETWHVLGRFSIAIDHQNQALARYREDGDQYGEAEALRRLADVHRDAGRYAEALEFAEAAVALAREIGEPRFEAEAMCSMATVRQRQGGHAEAIDLHWQALRLARQTRTLYPEAIALAGLAGAHLRAGQPEVALDYAEKALNLAHETGYRLVEGDALTVIAGVHLDRGQQPEAVHSVRRAVQIYRATGHRLGQARALVVLAQTTASPARATRLWRAALTLFTELGAPEAEQVRAFSRG